MALYFKDKTYRCANCNGTAFVSVSPFILLEKQAENKIGTPTSYVKDNLPKAIQCTKCGKIISDLTIINKIKNL